MIKSLIITHGNIGKEMIEVAEIILERKLDIEHISFDWKGDGSDMIHQVESFIKRNSEHKIIIFTDMFGGSPSNITTKFVGPDVEVFSGINLPGLLKFFSYQNRKMPFKEMIKTVEKGAMEGISIISEYLGEKK